MKAAQVGAFEAKTHLSELLSKVEQGMSFVITKRGRAVAELRPAPSTERHPRFGCDRGHVTMSEDFDAPLAEFHEYTA